VRIGQDLTGTGGADKTADIVLLFFRPGIGIFFFPEEFTGVVPAFAFFECLYSIQLKGGASVFPGQLLRVTAKFQSCCTARTLIFHNIVFYLQTPFFGGNSSAIIS